MNKIINWNNIATGNFTRVPGSSWSSIVKLLKLVAVENCTGVFSSLNLVMLSSKTLGLCKLFTDIWERPSQVFDFDVDGNSMEVFLGFGLGGTVWVGESGSSLGDTIPLVKRLNQFLKIIKYYLKLSLISTG